MTSTANVLRDCLEMIRPLDPLDMLLTEAVGCVLAQDVYAPHPRPLVDVATRDGYALDSAALRKALGGRSSDQFPVEIAVKGDIYADGLCLPPAGGLGRKIEAADFAADDGLSTTQSSEGTYIVEPLDGASVYRVTSGAPIPEGADCVVPLSMTDKGVDTVKVFSLVEPGAGILQQGADVKAKDLLLERGTRIGPRQVSLLAGVGIQRVRVHPHPRVAVITVGDELVDDINRHPGTRVPVASPRGMNRVFDSNSHALSVALSELGATVHRHACVPDDVEALKAAMARHLARVDLFIIAGGSSSENGAVQQLADRAATIDFEAVDMEPADHLGYGLYDGVPTFCLPGQPLATLVAYEIFVRPCVKLLSGSRHLYREAIRAKVESNIQSVPGRRQLVCAKLQRREDDYYVEVVGDARTQLLSDFVSSDVLAVIPEDAVGVSKGESLYCMFLTDSGK